MFDLGWSELLLIAVVAIIVVGPRDLPRMMRTVGQYVTKMRRMARDLQSQFNDALQEADLDDVGKEITELGRMNPARQIRDGLTSPLKTAGDALRQTAEEVEKSGARDGEPTIEAPAAPAAEPAGETPTALEDGAGAEKAAKLAGPGDGKPQPAEASPAESRPAEPQRAASGS